MIRLSREIRFFLTRPPEDGRIGNSWSGWPVTRSLVPYLELNCVIAGQPDEQTGYVCNIKRLDDLLRNIVTKRLVPMYEQAITDGKADQVTAERVIRTVYREAQSDWTDGELEIPIEEVQLRLSPQLSYSIRSENSSMVNLTQQFEFSAAHRLHCPDFSDEKNRELFGKCNNPEGHGHNYVVEITVGADVDSDSGMVTSIHEFESTVKRLIIDRLDHKHLNRDVEHFSKTIPSVENIAIAIWDWLDGQTGKAKLSSVKVYETPKTWAEYRGKHV